MQPYLYPYIGYFQLISAVDKFVLADTYQYTKQTWINRNRLVFNGEIDYFNIPVSKPSVRSQISEIQISDTYSPSKLYNKIEMNYEKTQGWKDFSDNLHEVLHKSTTDLYDLIEYSVRTLTTILEINTEICRISDLQIQGNISGEERVIAICKTLGATQYINLPGGVDLYSNKAFEMNGIELLFLHPILKDYQQKLREFESHLSILDVGFSIGKQELIDTHLQSYKLQGYDPPMEPSER